jgi:heat-inducible transcriptional repressor
VLNQPDFIDIKKIQRILNVIGNEYLLMDMLLNLSDEQDFVIKIGSEIFEEGPDDLSLVASRYRIYEHSTGTIGVLGPKRMDYYRVVSIINAFVKNLKLIFS